MRYDWKTILVLILFYLVINTIGVAQTTDVMPAERVYVHNSSSLLFPGDYLYYKCYVQRMDSGQLSDLSKVVYVELVNEKRQIIFSHKLFTENGQALGDFFIGKSLPTGSYKLLAFTEWMKNLGSASFFQSDISVINPYAPLPEKVVDYIPSEEIKSIKGKSQIPKRKINPNEGPIRLQMETALFEQRSQGRLYVEALTEDAQKGSYSISVRKKGFENYARHIEAVTFNNEYRFLPKKLELSRASILPELRGELLSGKIVGNEKNDLFKNRYVVLSFKDGNSFYNISKTDEEGRFHFNVSRPYDNGQITLNAAEDNEIDIEIFTKKRNDYSDLIFGEISIDTTLKAKILEKSVHNQIENAFSSVKADSIIPGIEENAFDPEYMVTYRLDDFTRFATLKLSIQEIVSEVGIRKMEGRQHFSVRTDPNILFENKRPLVLLDGMFIADHSKLMPLDSEKIDEIQVFTSNFVKNGLRFKGAILIQTKENEDLEGYSESPNTFNLAIPQKRKKYYSPQYDQKDVVYTAVPDFRYQLLWQPNVVFNKKEMYIDFYTSDVDGDFEIFLEGFTKSGIPVSKTFSFMVR